MPPALLNGLHLQTRHLQYILVKPYHQFRSPHWIVGFIDQNTFEHIFNLLFSVQPDRFLAIGRNCQYSCGLRFEYRQWAGYL